MVAGETYQFYIQSRDFFQNNIKLTLASLEANYKLEYSLLPNEKDVDFLPVTVEGTIVDVPVKLGAF
jgi:hypothetical protein